MGCASLGSEVSCRPSSNCRFIAVRSEDAQHVQADACNPEFSCQRWAPEPRGITVTGSEPAVDGERTLSPRRARSGGRSLRRDGAEHRTCDAPSRSTEGTVPVALDPRLESSRPPCGETERRPDSGASAADAPRVDGPWARLSPRSDPRISASAFAILTTHGHIRRAPRQTRLRGLAAPPLTPVRVRNDSFRCRRQMG